MQYVVNKEKELFIREDKLSNVIMIKETGEQFILNNSGYIIFSEIMNNNSLDKVKNAVIERYSGVDADIISQDVDDIAALLKIYHIINYVDVKVNVFQNGWTALDENEYDIVEDFVEHNKNSQDMVAGYKGYYTPQNIRAHVMNSQEFYFVYKNNGKTDAIAVVLPNTNSSVVVLTTFVVRHGVKKDEIEKIGKSLLKYLEKIMLRKVNKVRISYYSAISKVEPSYLSFYRTLGFEKEAILEKENDNQDLYMYSLAI